MPTVLIKRGTRSQINAAKAAGTLHAGELYLVTDENKVVVGVGDNAYTDVSTPRFQRGAGFFATGQLPVVIPIACTIKTALIKTSGGPGSCVFDVQRNGVSLCGVSKPTISNGTDVIDTALTGWTLSLSALDTLWIVCESLSGFTLADLTLILEPV